MNDHEIKTHSLTAGHLNVRPKRKGKTSIYKLPILGFHVFLGEVFVFFCEGIKLHANVWSVWGICPRNHIWLGVIEWPLIKCVHDGSNFYPHNAWGVFVDFPISVRHWCGFHSCWHVIKMGAISFSMSMQVKIHNIFFPVLLMIVCPTFFHMSGFSADSQRCLAYLEFKNSMVVGVFWLLRDAIVRHHHHTIWHWQFLGSENPT